MARIMIVEDEPIIADDLQEIIEETSHEVLGVFSFAEKAINKLDSLHPDLVMLDIELEGEADGVMLGEKIRETSAVPIVFVTSYSDKVTINRAKKVHPSGFIVKPFNKNEIHSNIEIALYNKRAESAGKKRNTDDFLFIKDGNSYVRLHPEDILYAQAEDNYTNVYTREKKFLICSTLKKVAEALNTGAFFRIHRSYLINLHHVDKFSEGMVSIAGHDLPVGKQQYSALMKTFRKL